MTAKLTRMANQIATFFESQPGAGPEAVAAHLNDFWAPEMRGAFAQAADPTELHPLVREALPLLRLPNAERG